MNILTARDLKKSFGKLPVLRGVDLTLKKGEIYVIFGSNGVGKTNMIKILATLTKPDSGRNVLSFFSFD